MKSIMRTLSVFAIAWLIAGVALFSAVSAADPGNLIINNQSITQINITGDNDGISSSSNSYKITATDSSSTSCGSTTYTARTRTMTFTNNYGGYIIVTYTIDSSGTLTPGSGCTEGTSGASNTIKIPSKGTFTIAVTSSSNNGASKLGSKTCEFKPTAIEFEKLTPEISFDVPSVGGTFTVKDAGENAVAVPSIATSSSYTFTAAPATGYKVFRWKFTSSDGTVTYFGEKESTCPYTASEAGTITCEFMRSDSAIYTVKDVKYAYLDEAITAAGKSGTVVVCDSGAAYHSNSAENSFIIPSGVKLLIPNSATDTGAFDGKPAIQIDGNITNNPAKAFRTLIIPSGTTITCYGQINVNGHRSANGQPFNGHVIGDYGKIILGEESTTFFDPDESVLTSQLTIGLGGKLYCYGYITGSGMVDVQSGGTVHELLQMGDWPGGGNGTKWKGDNYNNLFLCTQYYVQNIEAPLKIDCGATQYVEAVITITLVGEIKFSAEFISSSDGMFIMAGDGHLLRIYDQQNDRMNYHFKGGSCTIGTLSMSYLTYNITTENSIMPITNNISVFVDDNATFNVNKPVAILPGAELIIEDDGIANISSSAIYIYDVNDWKGITSSAMSSYFNRVQEAINGGWAPDNVNIDPKTNPLPYVATLNSVSPRATGYYYNPSNKSQPMTNPKSITDSGKLEVNGTLNINSGGYVYTSSDSASADKVITGTGKIVHNGDLATTNKAIASGTASYEISINFHNALGNLAGIGEMQAFSNGGKTYHGIVIDGVNWWYITEEVVPPTSNAHGYTKYYCENPESYIPTNITHSYISNNTICDVCGLFEFYASNVRLGNSLEMMFAFPAAGLAAENLEGYYVKAVRTYADSSHEVVTYYYGQPYVTVVFTDASGKTSTLQLNQNAWRTTTIDDVTYHVVSYSRFAAKEMCDSISLTVCKDVDGAEKVFSAVWVDSIQDYTMRLLTEHQDNNKPKLCTLLVDMLNYGAACQEHFGYDTGNLANAKLSDDQKEFGTQNAPEYSDDFAGNRDSTYWNSSTVIADCDSQFAVGFNSFTNGMYFTYSLTNHRGTKIEKMVTYDEMSSPGSYHELANLRIADARHEITITVYNANNEKVGTWSDSIEAYCYRMIIATEDDNQKAVYIGLLKFADAAKAYLISNEVLP